MYRMPSCWKVHSIFFCSPNRRIMKTDYKENEHKREVKDMLKISDYTNTVREEIEGSSGLKK